MAGIYERDQLNLQAALADALNRRENYRTRQNERLKNSIGEFGKIAETVGRTAEVGFTPEDEDNPEYRSARERYIMTGDRSGLYQYAASKRAAQEAAANRAFQASEAEKNRAFQAAEGAANRAIQREQNAANKVIEKARLIRNVSDSRALLQDIHDNPSKYGVLDFARAQHELDMHLGNAKSSGWFTDDEYDTLAGNPPKKSVPAATVPFKPGYAPEQTEAPAAAASNEGSDIPKISPEQLNSLNSRIKIAKSTGDMASIKEEIDGLGSDRYSDKEYQELLTKWDEANEKLKKKEANEAFAAAQFKLANDYVNDPKNTNKIWMALKKNGMKETTIPIPGAHENTKVKVKPSVTDPDMMDVYTMGGKYMNTLPMVFIKPND